MTSQGGATLAVVQESEPTEARGVGATLNLRIVRGPLQPDENEKVLSEYNKRIAPPHIAMHEYLRWVQTSPEGPAWHAILESNSHGIVGHQCLIPIRADWRGRKIVAAKSEYTFLHEDFQTAKIHGLERVQRPTHIVAANQLFQRGQSEAWGPFLISTTPSLRRRGFYGFVATDCPLWECLLILRPMAAARKTPSLQRWQRACLFLGGAAQKTVWGPAARFYPRASEFQIVKIDHSPLPEQKDFLSFFGDLESLRWRYPSDEYERLGLNSSDYLIYKRGSIDQYMRICQWQLDATDLSLSQIGHLIQIAQKDGAMGVRWSIYGRDDTAKALVRRLRRSGFLCVPHTKTIQIKSHQQQFLRPECWDLTDAMFSFHR